MATIGQNIRRYRKDKGMSQSELARQIGKSRAAISQYENDETTPRMGAIEDLARVFGVKKTDIIESRTNYAFVPFDNGLTNEERELIELFRSLSTRSKKAIVAGLRTYNCKTR